MKSILVQCKKYEHFQKPRLSQTAFLVKHFADQVGKLLARRSECTDLDKVIRVISEAHLSQTAFLVQPILDQLGQLLARWSDCSDWDK